MKNDNWVLHLIAAEEPTKQMVDWFEERTARHIALVQKYAKKIYDYDPIRFKGLIEEAKHHDDSKLISPEREPYIWVSWQYKCKDDGIDFHLSDNIENEMNKMTEHHVRNNLHHPESHAENLPSEVIQRDNRDLPPTEMIDATKMPLIHVAHMVADWMSMSHEKGTNVKDWADKNVNIRWKFTDEQKALIYELIGKINVENNEKNNNNKKIDK